MNHTERLAVIVTDSCHVVGGGGEPITSVRTFDLAPEIARYIAEIAQGPYTSYRLAIEHRSETLEVKP